MAIATVNPATGETEKTFDVLVNDDGYAEGLEFATLLLQPPSGGAALGTPNTATLTITDDTTEPSTNPIDGSRIFVGTHSAGVYVARLTADGGAGLSRRVVLAR